VCTGAVRVPASAAPELITLLAEGLGDAATRPIEVPPTPTPRWWDRAQRWVQSGLRRGRAA
jgi:hypothetical protein